MTSRLNRDDIYHLHESGIHVPSRTIVFWDDVEAAPAAEFIRNLHLLDVLSRDPITILFSTDGGDEHHGMAMYDAVRACRSRITIVCAGPVMSMGAIILQAADHRAARPNATIMAHDGTVALEDTPRREAYRSVRFDEALCRRLDDILVERIREKHPKYNRSAFARESVRGMYLTAEEALAKGLLDEILEPDDG